MKMFQTGSVIEFVKSIVVSSLFLFYDQGNAACFVEAAKHFDLPKEFLIAIAKQESNLNPKAVGHNKNGSRDIGIMQINSNWLPVLRKNGINEVHLLDPCVNVYVGAWVLSNNFRRLGYTVNALGAYNAASPDKRLAYAEKVLSRIPSRP